MSGPVSARDRFIAFRRTVPRPPHLVRQMVRVRGGALAVLSTPPVGDAPPLLCVNGGLLFSHRILWPALSPLAERRQLILYDQRGRGESEPPADPAAWRITDDAADVGALRRALGLRRWDVLGHSWGGAIAALGVERDQAGTRRLVTVDAVGATSAWMPALHEAALERLGPAERAVLTRYDQQALAADDPDVHSAHARAIYPAWFADAELASFFAPPRAASPTGAAVAAALRREGYDWTEQWRSLRVPTLVIHGERDPLPVSVARNSASLLPDARLAVIPGSGHMPFWETPEHFFALVEAFLSPGGPGGPPPSP